MLPLKFPLRYYEGQTIGGKPAPVGEPLPISVIYNGFCQNGAVYSSIFGIPSHNGVDCSNGFKTKVYAAHEGKVVKVFDASNSHITKGYGAYVLSDVITLPPDFPVHPNEEVRIMSVYWHASEVLVKVGDQVDRETPVILEGNTGKILGRENWTEEDIKNGRGSHLHFGIKLLKPDGITVLDENNGYGGYINPLPFFQYQLTFNPNIKTMRYIIDSRNDQYLVYDPLKIAFSIGDETELKFLKESGLTGEPERINKLDGYTIYPLVRQERLRDIFNL
jgi:murein DD-endopeptidase MepM/ murein hydrolase activator NlpD